MKFRRIVARNDKQVGLIFLDAKRSRPNGRIMEGSGVFRISQPVARSRGFAEARSVSLVTEGNAKPEPSPFLPLLNTACLYFILIEY